MLWYIGAILCVGCGIYFWLTKDHGYWKKRGVPYIEPRILVGNMGQAVIMTKSFGYIYTDLYREFEGHPYAGIFNMRTPALLLRDLDIIKEVLVKEFSKFHDIPLEVDEELDPILAKNPFFLRGDRWKITRSQITPLLTNAKMKSMFPLVQETCKALVKYLEEAPNATSVEDGVEAKELAIKFTTDNVASCAFGLEGNSFTDPNAEFRNLADNIFNFNFLALIRFFFISIFPELAKLLKVSIINRETTDKFKKIIMEAVKYRKENNVVRNDFLDSIIELKSKPMPFEYTPDHMVAHALTFFIDGSDTSATVFNFALFELAANTDVQSRFKEEIDSMLVKYNGTITFEAIQEMSYLDAIFLESLRMYPPIAIMSRQCTEEFTISRPNSSGTIHTLKVDKGTEVLIPVLGLHQDSQYYPEADRFDPDRFTSEAKHPVPKNCYFGFGDGPRICLGQRFANMQIKAGLIAIVSNFEMRLNSKTDFPLEMDNTSLFLAAKGGIWLNFYKRVKQE